MTRWYSQAAKWRSWLFCPPSVAEVLADTRDRVDQTASNSAIDDWTRQQLLVAEMLCGKALLTAASIEPAAANAPTVPIKVTGPVARAADEVARLVAGLDRTLRSTRWHVLPGSRLQTAVA